ncbi:MAG: hypothetical protein M3R55_01250 [Acidobacteriota bacterium]|nr:hypothetical protein [Acidobacteriota bacterium]
MPFRRRLACIAASVIAAAGMMSGHWLAGVARAAGEESPVAQSLAIAAWITAGVIAVLIDRTVSARAVALASLALPLVWFGMILVLEDHGLWMLGLAAMAVFALLAGLSAAAMKLMLRLATRHV